MECRNARLLFEFVRPGGAELDAEEAAALEQHLNDCSECAALAHFERGADERLGRAMRDVPVPAGLRERILGKLAVERDAWYRRWLVRAAGAAAALLVTALALWSLWPASLPAVAPNDIPYLGRVGRVADKELKNVFVMLNTETELPPNLELDLLRAYEFVTFHGRQVPELILVSDKGGQRPKVAFVYILSGQQFDLNQTKTNFSNLSFGGEYVVELTEYAAADGTPYLSLMIHTAGQPNPFWKHRAGI